MEEAVVITSGSDASFRLAFRQKSTGDLVTISNPVVIQQSQALSGLLTAELSGDGDVIVSLEGTSPLPAGQYYFRVQVTLASGQTLGSQRVVFNVV